jgi:hypothetical protein
METQVGMGRQIGQVNSGAFGVFSTKPSAPILVVQRVPCSMFSIIQPLFLQKTKPLYPICNQFRRPISQVAVCTQQLWLEILMFDQKL